MTLATLADVLQPALEGKYAVAGLVVLGWEDARAYVEAAERENAPVILQAGPSCRAHTPLPVLGAMFTVLAREARVPVVAHLDHGRSEEECREAIDCGFTSIMFDGSDLPLEENIEKTAKIADMAHGRGVSVEGEIGFVGYSEGQESSMTSPDDADQFARRSGVDAMAISIGNVHLQRNKAAAIDRAALKAIENVTDLPLVIHGGSGVPVETRSELARGSAICKFNIGTELRMVFGQALRQSMMEDPDCFDRIAIMKKLHSPLVTAARAVIGALGAPGKA